MRRIRYVFLVLLSAVLLPSALEAQQGGGTAGTRGDATSGFLLGQNYPNPFNPDTRIPFELFEEAFPEGRPANVSIRIFNLLRVYVGSPSALNHPLGDGTPVVQLEYSFPGQYEAYWDGRDRSGAQVSSGVYLLELTVNGRSQIRRMTVSR
jgi:hypothetical protein